MNSSVQLGPREVNAEQLTHLTPESKQKHRRMIFPTALDQGGSPLFGNNMQVGKKKNKKKPMETCMRCRSF